VAGVSAQGTAAAGRRVIPVASGTGAGAASTSLAMRPVGHALGELARLLGRPAAAVEHFAEAAEVARAWDARHRQAAASAEATAVRAESAQNR
jgi:hypothetical protein